MSHLGSVKIVLLGRDLAEEGGMARVQKNSPTCCRIFELKDTTVICTPEIDHFRDTAILDLLALIHPGLPSETDIYLIVKKSAEVEKWEKIFGKSLCENIKIIDKKKRQFEENPLQFVRDKEPKCFQQIEEGILSKWKESMTSENSGGNRKLNLVLLGLSGSGKSTSGNSIVGKDVFQSKPGSKATTMHCEERTTIICGKEITVIDTPDFFDEDLQQQERHVEKCRQKCEGVCVYLLVIQIGRFTEGERDILERLETILTTRIRDRAIILFTYGDDLSKTIEEYVVKTNKHLKKLITHCGNRVTFEMRVTISLLVLFFVCEAQTQNTQVGVQTESQNTGPEAPTHHHQDVSSDLKELRDMVVELRVTVRHNQDELKVLDADNNAMKERLVASETNVKALERVLTISQKALQDSKAEMKTEVEKLKKENAAQEAELKAMKSTLVDIEAEVKGLKMGDSLV
ncbi:GTPase IMAP family member 8-like [Engraulis encrasicolus]|uniref:GTPase IMAP family member 8-like n=1 Tax=Engraulis encrasicolus TaxID=184585 RepID=UPI002FD73050